jgi:hypothetical protein
MKALKEKRISLRSLWRRGLVILSLFALVFASCSDSSGDGGVSSRGPRVSSFKILKSPANNQYMGQVVDLRGLVVEVRYANGDIDSNFTYEGHEDMFTTNPRVVTGWDFNNPGELDATRYYDLIFDGLLADRPLNFRGQDGLTYPIITDVIVEKIIDAAGGGMKIEGPKNMGLNVTGTVNQKEAYVDDTSYDFSGLELWADYLTDEDVVKWLLADGVDTPWFPFPREKRNDYVWVPKIEKRPVPFQNVTWQIRPRYEKGVRYANGAPTDGVYDGYVWITVGQDFRYDRMYDYTADWTPGMGVSTPVPLEKVYTVKDIAAINLKDVADEDLLYNYFYWQENTKAAWIARMGPNAKLAVTYNDGLAPKEWWISDLATRSDIYLNSNPNQGALDGWDEEGVYLGPLDFDIMTIKYPITKKSGDLGVRIYYRGAMYVFNPNVFTILKAVVPEVDSVEFWPDPTWDNDVDNGPGGPVELSRRMTIKATYQAVNDASVQKEIELAYFWDQAKTTKFDPPWTKTRTIPSVAFNNTYWWGTGPYYIFSKDLEDDEFEADYTLDPISGTLYDYREGGPNAQYAGDNTYVKGYQKYLNNVVKKGPEAKTTTKVTVLHRVIIQNENGENLPYAYCDYFWPGTYGFVYPNGVLPNAWNYWVETATKGPYTTPGRNFGPKKDQKKKGKVSVTWVTHY